MKGGYEFKVVTIMYWYTIEAELNKLGRDGWKVVASLPPRDDHYAFVMERYLEVIF